jgi:Protein of unknown function (DUF1565)
MPVLTSHLHYVSASDKNAPFSSIGAALLRAIAGDTVFVGSGRYSPAATQERFPLYVPPGVTLAGAGQGESIIDGEGTQNISFRPVQEAQSLVLLGDGSALSGFSVINSGGNGIANQPGAHVLVARNEIRAHGQHGMLVSGPQEAVIKDNIFLDNGTKRFAPTTPRGVQGRQGHHIFVQAKAGVNNRVIITDNSMTRAFADGVAMVVFFDEPAGVVMHVSLINNLIEQSERRGLTIAASFNPSHSQVTVEAHRNVIRDNTEYAIAAQAARPLVTTLIEGSCLRLRLFDNECHQSTEGIVLFGGFGPANGNLLDAAVVGNLITGMKTHAVRIIGGIGYRGYGAHQNRVRAVISRNRAAEIGDVSIFIQGGVAEAQEQATGNEVLAHVVGNELPVSAGKRGIVVNDGLAGNAVYLDEPVQSHMRVGGVAPFHT